jgi:hypothetical protein
MKANAPTTYRGFIKLLCLAKVSPFGKGGIKGDFARM